MEEQEERLSLRDLKIQQLQKQLAVKQQIQDEIMLCRGVPWKTGDTSQYFSFNDKQEEESKVSK